MCRLKTGSFFRNKTKQKRKRSDILMSEQFGEGIN